MIDAYFSPKGILLQQEGELIHSSLKNGLLVIQGTNIDSKGDYYLAFLMLSTGLERLMKVTIIVDHMASNELRACKSITPQFAAAVHPDDPRTYTFTSPKRAKQFTDPQLRSRS